MLKLESTSLFTPLDLGGLALEHRVVMAPLTRSRTIQPDSVPGDLMREYYKQRATQGGLIVREATNISLASRGWLGSSWLVRRSTGGRLGEDYVGGKVRLIGSVGLLIGESRAVIERNSITSESHFRLTAVYTEVAGAIQLLHLESTDIKTTDTSSAPNSSG